MENDKRMLYSILDGMPMSVYLKDLTGKIIYFNKFAKEILGLSLSTQSYENEFSKANINKIKETDKQVLEEKCAIEVEELVKLKNNDSRWYNINKYPIYDNNDEISGICVIARDVEIERKAQEQRETYIATLTHDLKVPIVAESNMLDFLSNGTFGEINDKQREVLSKMKTSNSELIELVQMLLETYKSNNTTIELYKEDTSLNEFLEEVIDEMRPLAKKNDIQLNFTSPQNIIVNIDRLQFKRVIKNLIQNALSYSESSNDIDIKTNIQGGNVYISVIDYGKGISPKDIGLVFNKYFSTSKKYRKIGTGLGFYLSKQIIEAQDGEITVTSEEGVLTEFKIKLGI